MYASFHGYSIVVSLLLRRKKADVNVKNNVSRTLVIAACTNFWQTFYFSLVLFLGLLIFF